MWNIEKRKIHEKNNKKAMTRRKVKLAWIENDGLRKTTYRKRKLGLTKKVEELTILCGIEGCLLIFNPAENEIHVWPSIEKAKELLARFMGMPAMEQRRKMLDHEIYIKERIEKLLENIAKQEKRNKEMEASLVLYQFCQGRPFDEMTATELHLLSWFAEEKLKEIRRWTRLFPPLLLTSEATSLPPPQPPYVATVAEQAAALGSKIQTDTQVGDKMDGRSSMQPVFGGVVQIWE
ncbi:hypothetical protein Ancab_015066 [Ancistrocladus abbreviatus]